MVIRLMSSFTKRVIVELYNIELSKPITMACQLSDECLNIQPIEKQGRISSWSFQRNNYKCYDILCKKWTQRMARNIGFSYPCC